MIKRLIIAFILVVIVCGGLIGFNIFRSNAIKNFFATMQQPAVVISSVMVEPVTWTPGIDAFGTANAAEGTDVAVQVGGVVKSIDFKANDQMKSGQLMLQIDDAVERADLLSAQSQVTLNQQALDRAKSLAKSGVNSTVTVDNAQAQLDTAQSQLAKLQATLDQKAIEAPFDGTVGIPRVNVGQYAQPGTVIATLQNLARMKVDFTVPEQSLPLIHIGQDAIFGLTADTLNLKGQITGIDPKIDPQTRLVSVQALVETPNGELRPGQFIRIRVVLPEENNIIALPQTAVITSLYGDYVYKVGDKPAAATPAATPASAPAAPAAGGAAAPAAPSKVATQVFVKLGRRNDGLIEIASGVTAGEEIVTAGQNRLSNGSTVTVDNTVDPTKVTVPNPVTDPAGD